MTYLLHPVSAIPNTSLLLEILDIISTHCRLFDTCLDIITKSELGPVAPSQQTSQHQSGVLQFFSGIFIFRVCCVFAFGLLFTEFSLIHVVEALKGFGPGLAIMRVIKEFLVRYKERHLALKCVRSFIAICRHILCGH